MILLASMLSVAHSGELAWDWSSGHRYLIRARLRYPSATWVSSGDSDRARALDLEAQLLLGCVPDPARSRKHTGLLCTIEAASFGIEPHAPDADTAAGVAEAISAGWTGATLGLVVDDAGLLRGFDATLPEGRPGASLMRSVAGCLEVPRPEDGADRWTQKQSVTQRPLRLTHERQGDDAVIVYPTREARSVSFARRYRFTDGRLASSQHVYAQTYPDTQPGFTPIYQEHVRCEWLAPGDDVELPAPGVRDVSVPDSLR